MSTFTYVFFIAWNIIEYALSDIFAPHVLIYLIYEALPKTNSGRNIYPVSLLLSAIFHAY